MDPRVTKVHERIRTACTRVGRTPAEITVVAVSKYSSVEETGWFLQNGLAHLGENRIEMAKEKLAMYPNATWHFIGHLQSRKVRDIVSRFSFIHSVDRPEIAAEIVKRSEGLEDVPKCFLQVNISAEASKGGFSQAELREFVRGSDLFCKLRAIGLMTMTPKHAAEAECREIFRQARMLRDELRTYAGAESLTELSMGMSQDFEIAIEEGATFVRLGSVFLT